MSKCLFPVGMYNDPVNNKPSFKRPDSWMDDEPSFYIDCGRCINCRVRKAGELSSRVLLETRQVEELCVSQNYPLSSFPLFLTLTYDDAHYPKNELLNKWHLKEFLENARKLYGGNMRFLACGEYGDNTERAHYHALVWPSSFLKGGSFCLERVAYYDSEFACYSSDRLEALWPYGQMRINLSTVETISYVAGYVTKKLTGSMEWKDWTTRFGVVVKRNSGFLMYSRKPALGAFFDDELAKQFLRDGHIMYRNKKLPLPRYLKICLANRFPVEYLEMMERLKAFPQEFDDVSDEERQRRAKAREAIARALKKTKQQ